MALGDPSLKLTDVGLVDVEKFEVVVCSPGEVVRSSDLTV